MNVDFKNLSNEMRHLLEDQCNSVNPYFPNAQYTMW